jgi:hypothetical protein
LLSDDSGLLPDDAGSIVVHAVNRRWLRLKSRSIGEAMALGQRLANTSKIYKSGSRRGRGVIAGRRRPARDNAVLGRF